MTEQLQIDFARAEARLGMAQALQNAEADYPRWGEVAYAYLTAYAGRHAEFTAWMIVGASEVDKSFPVPENSRCWGGIFKRAVNDGLIADSGKTLPHPRRHACPAIVWRSLVFRGVE